MDEPTNHSPIVAARILETMLSDIESGELLSIETYQQRYPENEPEVLVAYEDALSEPSLDELPLIEESPVRIGAYRIFEEIGRGGQGVVYRAHDSMLDRSVAIKLLSGAGRLSQNALRRFRREGVVLARLRHPAICSVLAADMDGGIPFLVMELLDGRSLADLLAEERQANGAPGERLSRVAGLLADVADGLHHAHDNRVFHRDVTPRNILVDDNGRARLIDFGLAANLEDANRLTISADRFGTLAYMAPEQWRREETVDHRADIHAVGVILYEATTLGIDATPRGPRIRRDAVLTMPNLARSRRRDAWAVVETATAWDPASRYPDAASLASDLRALHEGVPVSVRLAGTITRLRRYAKRRPRRVALGAAALLLILVGFGVAMWAMDHADETSRKLTGTERSEALARYESGIAAAQRELELGHLEIALRHLASCPEAMRGFEWRYLMSLTDSSRHVRDAGVGVVSSVVRTTAGIVVVGDSGTIRLIGGGLPPAWLEQPTGAERLIEVGVLGSAGYAAWSGSGQFHFVWQGPSGVVEDRAVSSGPFDGDRVVAARWWESADQWVLLSTSGRVGTWAPADGGDEVRIVVRDGAESPIRAWDMDESQRRLAVIRSTRMGLASEIRVIAIDSRVAVTRISEPTHRLTAVRFSADGLRLVAAATQTRKEGGCIVRAWDTLTGVQLGALLVSAPGVQALQQSPATGDIWLGCLDGSLRRLDGGLTTVMDVYWGHSAQINAVAVTRSGAVHTGSSDGTVRTWDGTRGAGSIRLQAHLEMCRCLVVSPAGVLWCMGGHGSLEAWDLSGREKLRTVTLASAGDLRLAEDSESGIEYASWAGWFHYELSRQSATACGRDPSSFRGRSVRLHPTQPVLLWEDDAHALRVESHAHAEPGGAPFLGLGEHVERVAASDDGTVLAASGHLGGFSVWREPNRQTPWRSGHMGSPEVFALGPRGRTLILGGADGALEVWPLDAPRSQSRQIDLDGVPLALAVSPDGSRLAVGSLVDERGAVSIWDLESGRRLLTIKSGDEPPSALAWSPQGDLLALGGLNGGLSVLGSRSDWKIPDEGAPPAEAWEGQVAAAVLIASERLIRSSVYRHRPAAGAILAAPFELDAWYHLALAAGDWAEARSDQLPDGPRWRGAALVRLGRHAEGVELLERARQRRMSNLGPEYDDNHALAYIALSHALRGDMAEARSLRSTLLPSGAAMRVPYAELDLLLSGTEGAAILRSLSEAARRGEPLDAIVAGLQVGDERARALSKAAAIVARGARPSVETVTAVCASTAYVPGLSHVRYATAEEWAKEARAREAIPELDVVLAVLRFRQGAADTVDAFRRLGEIEISKARDASPLVLGFLALAEHRAANRKRALAAYNRFVVLAAQRRHTHDPIVVALRGQTREDLAIE